jgi:membrane protein required for colicin V production
MLVAAVNAVDVVVLALLGVAFILGMIRGFISQLVGIVFLVGGLLLASKFCQPFGDVLRGWFEALGEPVDAYVAFLLILAGTVVGGHLVAMLFRGLLEKMKLMAYDRFLGGVIGAVKALLILVIVIHAVVWFLTPEDPAEEKPGFAKSITESRSWRYAVPVGRQLYQFVPEDLKAKIRSKWEDRGLLEEPEEPAGETPSGE